MKLSTLGSDWMKSCLNRVEFFKLVFAELFNYGPVSPDFDWWFSESLLTEVVNESSIVLISIVVSSSSPGVSTSSSSLLPSLIEVASSLRIIALSLLSWLISRLGSCLLLACNFLLNSLKSLVILLYNHLLLLLRLLIRLNRCLSLLLRKLLLCGSQIWLSYSILGSSSHKVWYLSNFLLLIVRLVKLSIKIIPLNTCSRSKTYYLIREHI